MIYFENQEKEEDGESVSRVRVKSLKLGPVAGSSQHGNELVGPIKVG
jgi:hypothetical protein